VGLPDLPVERAIAEFDPDVLHLTFPMVLGAVGPLAAHRLGIPTVGVYQTAIGAFARQYGVRALPVIEKWDAARLPLTGMLGRQRGRAVSLREVGGPFFVAQPAEKFAMESLQPSAVTTAWPRAQLRR
jgi:hypothetical protein